MASGSRLRTSPWRRTRSSALVEAGNERSAMVDMVASSSSVTCDAVASEQTTRGRSPTRSWFTHSRMAWLTRAMDGAANRTVPCRQRPSASRSAMSVLPVPHAMIALQRSNDSSFALMSLTASRWCSLRS